MVVTSQSAQVAAKKQAATKAPAKPRQSAAKPKPKQQSKPLKEVRAADLTHEESKKRLDRLYRLEKAAEKSKATLAAAAKAHKAAREKHKENLAALERELREQRFGPGPLWDATGKQAAPR